MALRPRQRWPRGQMAVRIDYDTGAFFRGLLLGMALSAGGYGVVFGIWIFVR